MKYFPHLSALIVLLISACGILPGQDAATSTPAPTNTATAAPTLTPLPTETLTPVPTITPDKTATAAFEVTETADSVLDELDRVLGDTDIPYQDGYLAWEQGKPLLVSLSGPGGDYVEIDKNLVGKNFILKSDVTWEATGILICGVIFRSEPNLEHGKQYALDYLRLSGLPAWEIGVFQYGGYQSSITKTQFSDAIDQKNGATNQVMLIAQDEQFTLYINNVRQGRYFDTSKQRMEGVFAFRGAQDSGEGTCNFENSWVWALE